MSGVIQAGALTSPLPIDVVKVSTAGTDSWIQSAIGP